MKLFRRIREKFKRFGDLQNPDLGRRGVWGGVFGAIAAVIVVPFYQMLWYSPLFHYPLAVLDGMWTAMLAVLIARIRPDNGRVKAIYFPLAAGGVVFLDAWLGRSASESHFYDLAMRLFSGGAAEPFEAALILRPILGALLIFILLSAFMSAMRLPGFQPKRRLLFYGLAFVSYFVLEILLTVGLAGISVRQAIAHLPYDEHLFLIGFFRLAMIDAGQLFGGSRFASRHRWKLAAGVAGILVLLPLIFWRPLAAEYHYLRGMFLLGDKSKKEIREQHLTRAWQLNPKSDIIAHAYSEWMFADKAYRTLFTTGTNEAIHLLQKAIEIFPDSPDHYTRLSLALRERGQMQEAIQSARKAIEIAGKKSVRRAANRDVLRLNMWGPLECEDILITLLVDEGSTKSIEEVLGYLDPEQGIGPFSVHAAEQLARHNVRAAIDPLEKILEEIAPRAGPEEWPRQKLREALDRLTSGSLEKTEDLPNSGNVGTTVGEDVL